MFLRAAFAHSVTLLAAHDDTSPPSPRSSGDVVAFKDMPLTELDLRGCSKLTGKSPSPARAPLLPTSTTIGPNHVS